MWRMAVGAFVLGCVLGLPVAPLQARAASFKGRFARLPRAYKAGLFVAAIVPVAVLLVTIYLCYMWIQANPVLAISFMAGLTAAYLTVSKIMDRRR